MNLVQQFKWRQWNIQLFEDGTGSFKIAFNGSDRPPSTEEHKAFFDEYQLSIFMTEKEKVWRPPVGQPGFMRTHGS